MPWSITVTPSGNSTSTDAHRLSATISTCFSGNSASRRSSFSSPKAALSCSSAGTEKRPLRLMLPNTVVIVGGSGGAGNVDIAYSRDREASRSLKASSTDGDLLEFLDCEAAGATSNLDAVAVGGRLPAWAGQAHVAAH